VPQLILITLFAFMLSDLMPGDWVAFQMVGGEFTFEEIQAERARLGLDDPWFVQYTNWLTSLVQGDWGHSHRANLPVRDVIFGYRFWNTIRLSLMSTIMFFLLAVPLGILAGRYYRRWPDKLIILYGFMGAALPNVVLGLVLIWFFGIYLSVLPPIGSVDTMVHAFGTPFEIFISQLRHLILPSMALATFSGIGMMYILRTGIVDGRSSDYAMTARSKGVPERVIFNKHILRNSLIPFAQGIGFTFTGLMGGSVLIENIFRFPGMGQLFVNSIVAQDTPVAIGLIFFYSALAVLAVLIGDIALAATDPRIRVR